MKEQMVLANDEDRRVTMKSSFIFGHSTKYDCDFVFRSRPHLPDAVLLEIENVIDQALNTSGVTAGQYESTYSNRRRGAAYISSASQTLKGIPLHSK
jgi:hypothetical protein